MTPAERETSNSSGSVLRVDDGNSRTRGRVLLAALLLVAAALAVAGRAYYTGYRDTVVAQAREELQVIADLKVARLVAWRRGRIADAEVIRASRYAAAGVERALAGDENAARGVRAWFTTLATAYQYDDVYAVTPAGTIAFSVAGQTGRAEEPVQRAVSAVTSSHEVRFSLLHRSPGGRIHIDVVTPLAVAPDRPPIACVVLEVEPETHIFPLIELWPTRSRSAETLLVRRDGADVLFLTELRHRTGTALTLREPADDPDLPAARAIRGETGPMDGLDYRGAEVIAAARHIPGSPWVMISKIDRSEVLQPVRERGLVVGVFVILLVSLAGTVTRLLLRHQREAFLRQQLDAERERQALQRHFESLHRFGNDIIILVAADGAIVDANDRAVEAYRYSRDELLGLTVTDLRAPEAREDVAQALDAAEKRGSLMVSTVHRRKDGSTFPVEASVRRIDVDGASFFQSIVRDITERREAEARLRESEERYRRLFEMAQHAVFVLSGDNRFLECNQATERVFGRSRAELCTMTPAEISPPFQPDGRSSAEAAAEHIDRAMTGEPQFFQWRHSRPDGSSFAAEVELSAFSSAGETFLHAVVRDVSDRQKAEERVHFLNRLLRTVSEVNQEIVRERDAGALLRAAADILVERGEFHFVWIALADPDDETLRAAAWSGDVDPDTVPGAVDPRTGDGPSVMAFTEGRPAVVNDTASENRFPVWLTRVERLGCRSVTSCPLVTGGARAGVLTVGSRDPGVMVSEVVDLIEELAGDLGYALEAIRRSRSLEQQEELYRLLTERAHDIIYRYRFTPDRGFDYVSPSATRMIGYTPEEHYADPDIGSRIVHPDDLPRLKELQDLGWEEPFVSRWVTRDGRMIWVEQRNTFIRDASGTVTGVQGIARNVTDRVEAEAALRRSEATQRAIIEASPVAIWSLDRNGCVTQWNPAAERTFGWTEAEALGQVNPIVPPEKDAEFRGLLAGLLAGGGFSDRELVRRRRDGSEVVISLSTAPLHDQAGGVVGVMSVAMDITEHRRTEEQLRHAQKLEAVGRLAGGVAHDFNNLLQAMVSVTELLEGSIEDPRLRADRLAELAEHLRRAAQLTRQLLIFSRRESTKFESLDLNVVVAESAELVSRLKRANVDLELRLHPEPLRLNGDRGQLEQVLMNLAVNAFDAMPDGGTLTLTTARESDGDLSLTATDTGSGIPEAIRGHVFEPFFTTKPVGQGTGLGLSVVHGIVARHGGSVTVESTPGSGTVFRIVLPARRSGEVPAVRDVAGIGGAVPATARARILVIEDEEGARVALEELLRQLGHDVVAVGSGAQASALPREPAFDLLLTDFLLPDAAGTDLAMQLLETWPRAAVILMSGYTSDTIVRTGIAEGSIRFLQKPFDSATLAREIAAALDEPR